MDRGSAHTSRRRRPLVVLLLSLATVAVFGIAAMQALAVPGYAHDGATACSACHDGSPSAATAANAMCITCHSSFMVPNATKMCWSCHVPGQDASALSTPSSACSQGCHLWDDAVKGYTVPFTHGETPHVGASGYGKTCLDCHETSAAFNDPNGSPHHSGQTTPPPTCQDCHNGVDAVAQVTHDGNPCTSCHTGMNIPPVPATCNKCHPAATFGTPDCLQCHTSQVHNTKPQAPACSDCHGTAYKQHAGKVACLTCHTGIAAFHHGQSSTTTQKNCRSCHAKKHAGKNVPNNKCATCHKGTGTGPAAKAQHSTTVTKNYVCSTCHSKPLHASAFGSGITSCRRCHKGKYHAAQKTPSNTVCTGCHGRAARHSNGYGCALCHRSAVHNATPTATPTPTPSPSSTAIVPGFPTTGYPPGSGGSPWLLVTGIFVGGVALLFAAWRLRAASRRHN